MSNDSSHNLTITRILDAPIDRVWQAWTDPEQLQKWWGPRGVTNPTCIWQAQPGGKINIVMLAGEELGELKGNEWPMTGSFQEVSPPNKLVYTATPILDGKEFMESTNSLTLEDQGGKTKLIFKIAVTKITPEAAGPLAGMEMGWNQSLDKLTEYIGQEA